MKQVEFSQPQVCKALGVEYQRLREWMKAGHIKPSSPAGGRGYPARFRREEICLAGLFSHLLGLGFSRAEAGERVKLMRLQQHSLLHTDGDLRRARFVVIPMGPGFSLGHSVVCSEESYFQALKELHGSRDMDDFDNVLIVNYGKIIDRVDKALEGLR